MKEEYGSIGEIVAKKEQIGENDWQVCVEVSFTLGSGEKVHTEEAPHVSVKDGGGAELATFELTLNGTKWTGSGQVASEPAMAWVRVRFVSPWTEKNQAIVAGTC